MQFPKLFSPIKVGSLELSNRFVVPPMGFDLTNEVANGGGIVNQAVIDYWVARARGGWGLLIFEFTAIDPLGKAGPRHIGIWDDAFVDGFKKLTEAVHKYGARIAVQLGHAGRQTTEKIIGAQPVSASPIACPVARETPRELASEEVYELVEKFGDAAVRARDAGFDAVEIHGAHGYLIAQFMSAYTNKRIDEFGGSFHNRMKFPVEIIRNVRRKVGAPFPLLFRISGEEKVPGGRTIDETRAAARMLVEAGIDAIDVSVSVNVTGKYIIAPAVLPPGFLLPFGEEIKKAVSVPVISVGRINHPMFAEDAIETGKADLIAWGRSSLADPELPNKVAAGQLDDICPCIACLQGCARLLELHDDPLAELKVTCLVNPFCARESEMKIKPAAEKKKVVIIGGGPGGLEAAWVAAACGHQVTLYEKQKALGGQFRIAAIPPFKQEIARDIAYYIHMCQKHGVLLKTGVTATVDQLLAEKPDVVIVATGGEPFIPDIEGASGARVVTAWDILEGKKPAGNRVLIVGGGMVGCEVADFLGEHLHEVTLIEMLPEIARDVPLYVRDFLTQRLRDYNVNVKTGTSAVKFLDNGVIVNKDGNESRLEGFDTIVLALGAKSVNDLKEQLAAKVPELYVIGDALAPRQAIDAIEEGARVALKL
jgi:2,4-dienoyl-CoA reductase-like NADH-dependent reductase (Old Yellow Enzyme family)/NADPH-dependent 2,4-dienoyl-CoA reductase/sulfur reductase-like enzyme